MENKTNTGAIFKNTNKSKETHPDYKGKVNVRTEVSSALHLVSRM
jgi:hypothetical protein